MATATEVLLRITEDGLESRVEVDYDDTSNPEDWTLLVARCVNGLTHPVRISIQRGNGVSWANVIVAAGETLSQNTGGPVRRVSHIPHFTLRTE